MVESFYELLGIGSDADAAEIRRAYRERLKETHPDVSEAPDADDRTRRLLDAKETLLDDTERARYDRLGHEAYRAGPVQAAAGRSDAGDAEATVDRTAWTDRSAEADSGPTNARAGPWARRDRERHTAQRVGTGRWRQRRDRQNSGAAGTVADSSDPHPWSSRVEVTVEPGDVRERAAWLSVGESPVMALSAFVLYPIALGGSVFPPFPIWLNVLVAVCALAMVAALQAMPAVGVIVFGSWSILGTLGLAAAGTSPLSFVGLLVVATTWFPLGLTLLTAWILRS